MHTTHSLLTLRNKTLFELFFLKKQIPIAQPQCSWLAQKQIPIRIKKTHHYMRNLVTSDENPKYLCQQDTPCNLYTIAPVPLRAPGPKSLFACVHFAYLEMFHVEHFMPSSKNLIRTVSRHNHIKPYHNHIKPYHSGGTVPRGTYYPTRVFMFDRACNIVVKRLFVNQ